LCLRGGYRPCALTFTPSFAPVALSIVPVVGRFSDFFSSLEQEHPNQHADSDRRRNHQPVAAALNVDPRIRQVASV
jgi:hypothetical protein